MTNQEQVFYCPLTDELWIIETIKNENYVFGITWNDICFLDEWNMKNFIFIGDL